MCKNLKVRVNLPAAGREASFVNGLCQESLNLYPNLLTLNHTGFLTLTLTKKQFLRSNLSAIDKVDYTVMANYFVFVERLRSNLKKSVVVFDREETFWVGPVPSLKHSRIPPFSKLT